MLTRAICALLVCASLVFKSSYPDIDPHADDAKMATDIAQIFSRKGYQVGITKSLNDRPPIITVQRGACVVKLRDNSYVGRDSEQNNQLMMHSAGATKLVFQGQYFSHGRSLWSDIYLQTWRDISRLGYNVQVDPVTAIAASPDCRPPAKWLSALSLLVG